MGKQVGFYFQQDRCVGCFTCQIACKDKNDLEVGQNFRKVKKIEGGSFIKQGNGYANNIYAFWTSIACNHCQDPKCVKGCPTGAMTKRPEDGIVHVDKNKCVGCSYCEMNCPYHAPQLNKKTGKMGKCDMCKDLLAKGEKPICVDACPMRALDFGDIEELKKKYQGTADVKGLPSSRITKPNLVIHPHKNAGKN